MGFAALRADVASRRLTQFLEHHPNACRETPCKKQINNNSTSTTIMVDLCEHQCCVEWQEQRVNTSDLLIVASKWYMCKWKLCELLIWRWLLH